jgi:hypothetical protein
VLRKTSKLNKFISMKNKKKKKNFRILCYCLLPHPLAVS